MCVVLYLCKIVRPYATMPHLHFICMINSAVQFTIVCSEEAQLRKQSKTKLW